MPLIDTLRAKRSARSRFGRDAAGAAADRQRLSRRAADQGRVRRRRRHRHHRPLRRQRAGARHPDARIRLGGRRLRPSRRRQPGRPHPGMRPAGDRRHIQRLGERARLAQYRLSDRRVPQRRQLRRLQTRGHRRPDRPGGDRRTDAVRDRRSRRLFSARRDGRFLQRPPHPGRRRQGQSRKCARPAADQAVQSVGHLPGRLPGRRDRFDRRAAMRRRRRSGPPRP